MADLTDITDVVTVGGRETTILDEFQKQVGGEPTTTPTFRAYRGNGSGSPSDTFHVTIWNKGGETASFQISEANFKYLRGQ